MSKLHILCKNRKTLSKQKLILFRDEISTIYEENIQNLQGLLRNLRPTVKTFQYKVEENELQRKNRYKIHNRSRLCM
jgi:hypothetical protein